MASFPPSLVFTVRRKEPTLVPPSKPTPRELKQLSDIDDQEGLRFQFPVIMFYKRKLSMEGEDPVKVIREALAEALVLYYPFAGRIIEGPNRKLMVDCTSEGVLFIEADADIELNQLIGDTIDSWFSYLDEFLHDVPGSEGILGCPLLLIQPRQPRLNRSKAPTVTASPSDHHHRPTIKITSKIRNTISGRTRK